jgi:hypothetical protein
MGGGLLLASAVGCLTIFGWLAAGAIDVRSAAIRGVSAYVLAWTGLVVATLAVSAPGALNRGTLTAGLAVLAAAAVAFRLLRTPPPAVSAIAPAWREAVADPVVRTLAITVAVAGAYVTAVAFLTTPNDWDGLTYHETRALLWNQQGGIGYVPSGNDPRLDGNPPVAEVGLYLATLLPRSERFGALPQYAALWASLLAVILLARRLGLSRPAAAYGGLVFATLPIVLLDGAAILNDLVVASFLLAAVVLLSGRSRAELAVGSLALGLALSTKFHAALALPVVIGAALSLVPSDRRRYSALACGAGVLLGAPWYVLNVAETGSPTGGLGDSTGQTVDHSLRALLGTFRALAFDVVDTSGLWKSELYVAVAVGGAMTALGLVRLRRGHGSSALVYGGLVVGLVPLLLRATVAPTRWVWLHGWYKLGHEGIALDNLDAWRVLGLPDTSQSWYGAAGAVVVVGGIPAAIVGVRRGLARRSAILLAVAPLVVVAIFAVTIVYDPWRGRLLMFAVGLACAAWGWTIRARWLATGVAGLCVVTVALSLVHWYTKPSGLGLLEPSISRSVWHRDRIDTLTVIRDYDGTPALLRRIEDTVPTDAVLAVAAPIDTFLAPLAGPHLSRKLRLVPNERRVPPEATWLVTRRPSVAAGCPTAWSTVYADKANGWRLLRRTKPDECGASVTPV